MLAGALTAGLALAGCGGEPAPPDDPPAKLLDGALRASGVDALLSGSETPPLSLEFTADLPRFGIDGTVVLLGDRLYVVFFGENYRADAATLAALRERLGALGLDPREWFPDPGYDGVEETGGRDSVRIVSPLGGRARLGELAGTELRGGTAEAWVSLEGDSLLRLRFSVPRSGELDVLVESGGVVAAPEGGGFQPLDQLLDRLGSLVP
jgi:hypothetical protein